MLGNMIKVLEKYSNERHMNWAKTAILNSMDAILVKVGVSWL